MDHYKIRNLPDGAFRLWVEGLAHCQKHLTDGYISDAAARVLWAYSPKRKAVLLASGLWEQSETGIRVHDYLQWNESREHVMAIRAHARERMAKLRGGSREHTPNTPRTDPEPAANDPRTFAVPRTHHTTPPRSGKQNGNGGPADARSKRPIFKGQRFVVFEWMLDDLRRMLGSHADAFDLHAWFFDLDAEAAAANVVVPQRDGGQWLQERTHAEALRRGLPIAVASHNPKTAGNLAAAQRFIARGQA